MNRLVFCGFMCLIVAVASQQAYPNQYGQQYPQPGQFPNFQQPQFPDFNEMCKKSGTCKVDSRFAEESSVSDNRGTTKFTRVCDNTGCYDRKVVMNGSSATTISSGLLIISAIIVGVKIYIH